MQGRGEASADPSMDEPVEPLGAGSWGTGGVSETQEREQEAPGPWVMATGPLDSNHALLHTSL